MDKWFERIEDWDPAETGDGLYWIGSKGGEEWIRAAVEAGRVYLDVDRTDVAANFINHVAVWVTPHTHGEFLS